MKSKTKKIMAFSLVAMVMLLLFAGCGQQQAPAPPPAPDTAVNGAYETNDVENNAEEAPEPVELLIGAAMSLIDVVEELSAIYTSLFPHVTLVHTFASSGALQGQIEEGAPIDIFFSAAAAQMRNLEEQGLIYGQGRTVVTNTVALIVPADSDIAITSFEDVALDAVGIIGVGDPDAMPIGRFAREVFTSLGIVDEVYDKAVLASDVRQILTWVETGEVDAGVVFMTDAIASDDVRVIEVADPSLHAPSVNPVGIVETSSYKEEAQNFIDFLFSGAARTVFEQHRFTMY